MEVLCQGQLQRDSDFFQVDSEWIDGACPATALANAASSALNRRITPLSVYLLMRSHPGPSSDGKLCEVSGAATIDCVRQAALLLGCEIAAYRPYAEPWDDWEAWHIAQLTTGNPLIVETAFGQALRDSITGLGDNYIGSLFYHFYDEVGYFDGTHTSPYAAATFNKILTSAGFWSGDGDNWAWDNGIEWNFDCGDKLQFYPTTIIAAAQPCAAIALLGRKAPVWTTQTNGDGKDSEGHVCSPGFMKAMADNPVDLASDGLAGSIALPNATGFLALQNGTVYIADPITAAFKCFASEGLGQEWMKLYGLYLEAKNTPIETDPTAVALANAVKAVVAAPA